MTFAPYTLLGDIGGRFYHPILQMRLRAAKELTRSGAETRQILSSMAPISSHYTLLPLSSIKFVL